MKKLWAKYRKFVSPAFLVFEAVMHLYLVIYLTFNWTNWLVWSFTALELAMFIYILFDKDAKGHSQVPKGHTHINMCDTCPFLFNQEKCSC